MTIAQCKAFRRNMLSGEMSERYKPKKGSRSGSTSRSTKRSMAIARKVIMAGGGTRSIGFGKK